ncbi:hypothetical protein N431DRAFT_450550 [Stipitochalara longipes BDJ]|nr:hypothetical protein N431DRAFT_450550 [Stipitochalara longipes BDJ]
MAQNGAFTDVERNGNGDHLQPVDSLSMDPAVYERLFLNPQTAVKHDLRRTFAIPTPLALVGFGVALTPLSCCLMGWRGADQMKMGNADIGAYMWFGGLTVVLSALMEFIMGNTFSFVLFMGYGAWFLTYAATLQPFYNAAGAYTATPGATQEATQAAGQLSAGYPASFAFILVFMAVFSFIMLICSARVNVVLVVLIFGVFLGFVLVSAALFIENQAILNAAAAVELSGTDSAVAATMLASAVSKRSLTLKLVKGGGAAYFAASMMNWYLVLAILLFAVDFPILIGVYDLSTVVPGKSQLKGEHRKQKAKKQK